MIVDNQDADTSSNGTWSSSTSITGYVGSDYQYSAPNTDNWFQWSPQVTTQGTYNLYMRWTAGSNRPTAAPVEVAYSGNYDTSKTVDQTVNNGTWVLIGTYQLTPGTDNYVKLYSVGGFATAYAVKWVKQ